MRDTHLSSSNPPGGPRGALLARLPAAKKS